jgi:hypothetical protein
MAAMLGGEADREFKQWSKVEKVEQEKVNSFELFQKIQANDGAAVGELLLDSGQGEKSGPTELAEERARGDREREETKNKKSEQYVASRKDRNARRRQKKRQLRVSRNAKIGHEPNPKRNDCTDVVVETVNEFDSECESESELPELTKRTKLVDAVMKNELACPEWPGLCPPTLLAGERINGENKRSRDSRNVRTKQKE